MAQFDTMNTGELLRCLRYLDWKRDQGKEKQAIEDEAQRSQIICALRKRETYGKDQDRRDAS